MRYFFEIAYSGQYYNGWQRQLGQNNSVQATIEDQLSKTLKNKITCIGCGRTDAGVHASQYFFHINTKLILPKNLKFILNKSLPNDIVIFSINKMEEMKHAQFDAKERTYEYFIHTQKNPFLVATSAYYTFESINFEAMQKAVALISKYDDFRAFCKTPNKHNSTICDVKTATLIKNNNTIHFQITSNRFIRGMIRLLVAKLIAIGQNRFTIAAFETCLKTGERPEFMEYAYPQGLYLSKIKY